MKKLLLILILLNTFLFANNSVLILSSYHKGYEFSDKIIEGIESKLFSKTDYDLNTLYMDSKRLTSKKYYVNLEKLYEMQLANIEYDLVIAVDRFAYDFVLDTNDKFFKDKPILAVGIESFSKTKAKKYAVEDRVSVLLEKRDLKGNLEVVEKLIPSIKKLFIINDKSLNALHTEPLIEELIRSFHNRYELIYLKEDSLEDLKDKFSKYEENSAAIFIRFYKNKNGKLNKNRDISKFIKDSKIPIFITDSIFINRGATGGRIVNLKHFGEESGRMAIDILEKNLYNIREYKNLEYVFDSQKLLEFTLPVDALSSSYKLVNKRVTFFDENKGFIHFIFAISPVLILLIIGLFHNIYKRKIVEKELRQRIDFDSVLLNAIESPIFWQDEKGILIDSNEKFNKFLSLDTKEIHGRKLEDFKNNKNAQKILKDLNTYQEFGYETYEFKYFDENMKKRIYLLKQAKYNDIKSKKEGVVTILTDITKEKEIELEKEKNKEFIIQQSKLAEIGEVFSSIAHQWKSPLVEITAIAQELFYTKKQINEKEDDSFVSEIMTQVNYMTNTINDFQKFIMPSNTQVEFDVHESIESMLEIVNHNLKYNNIKVTVNVEDNACLLIYGYKNEFMQSFLNIINNAKDALLKNDYKNRKIDVEILNEKDELIILIQDNAGGVDSKNIHKVFKPYYSTKSDGHGIGLYMCKMIIEDKMNGNISVENKNDGACFKIRLGYTCENISS